MDNSNFTFGERIISLFHPDPVIPIQYLATFRRNSYLEPEKELMLAVLEDAVACLQKYAPATNAKGKSLLRDTKNWILAEDDDWIFSFNNVCETLGLNPTFVRRALTQLEMRQSLQHETPQAAKSYRARRRSRINAARRAA
jgi:hypothetical protein